MPDSGPFRPLIEVGDFLLQLAPHNVLARGGQITIAPVMGRQPTMYEEMSRVRPLREVEQAPTPAPVQRSPTIFDVGDDFLRLAPHNVLFTLLTGGQAPPGLPSVPGMQAPPTDVSLAKYSRASGNYEWDPTNMSVKLNPSASVAITAPSDMDLVVTSQRFQRKTTERRTVPWANLEKFPPESDPDFIPSPGSVVEQHTVSPGRQVVVAERRGRSVVDEKGPAGVLVYKRIIVDYATRVTLAGVIPKAPPTPPEGPPKVPTVPPVGVPPEVPIPPIEVPEVPTGPTPEELQAQATAEARRRAEEEARQRELARIEERELATAEYEARVKAEREQRAVELEERQAAARVEMAERAARQREEEERKAEESRRQYEEFQEKMEATRRAQAAEKGERQLKAEEVSARALELRQLAARRRLKR